MEVMLKGIFLDSGYPATEVERNYSILHKN